jgi:hypothetical protein
MMRTLRYCHVKLVLNHQWDGHVSSGNVQVASAAIADLLVARLLNACLDRLSTATRSAKNLATRLFLGTKSPRVVDA